MDLTPKDAADILQQIRQNQWKWLKVKRFAPDEFIDLESRYAALENHHTAETGRMIEVIDALCRLVGSLTSPQQPSSDTTAI